MKISYPTEKLDMEKATGPLLPLGHIVWAEDMAHSIAVDFVIIIASNDPTNQYVSLSQIYWSTILNMRRADHNVDRISNTV